MKKLGKIICLALSGLLLLTEVSCKPGTSGGDQPTFDPFAIEDPTEAPVEMRDVSGDTPLADSVVFANQAANSVQARYLDGIRSRYNIQNRQIRLTENLISDKAMGLAKLENLQGGVYLENTMDAFVIDSDGQEWSSRNSATCGRINTTRLGYYYYETFVRDQGFGVAGDDSSVYGSVIDLISDNSAWGGHDMELSPDKGKNIAATVSSSADPYLCTLDIPLVPRNQVTHIAITLRTDSAGGACECFFTDTKSKGKGWFDADKCVKFNIVGDGAERTYLIDISDKLQGDLNAIRFDMGSSVGDRYEIINVRAVTLSGRMNVVYEKCFHTYPDKLHQVFRIVANDKVDNLQAFGMLWEMPADRVTGVQVCDNNGPHNDDLTGIEPETVSYVAFKVKDAGVVGIIVPSDGSTLKTTVEKTGDKYVVRQYASGKLNMKKGGDCRLGNRIYTDTTDKFDGIYQAAYLERVPLFADSFTVNETTAGTKFKGYDALRGVYLFNVKGTTFNEAYAEKNRNRYYSSCVTVENDSRDRQIYLWFNSGSECLECAALLDENKQLVPIPMQVGKNFTYEKEEPLYDPTDVPYEDSFFPLVLDAEEKVTFTDLHLYMNWGKYPLKQLSSIQFHVTYYHLSTGVTESNCISPYGVYGKDGFLLPDFRGRSGVMWKSQPQFTSTGRPKATSYIDNEGNKVMSEYVNSKINCSGPTYADLEYTYVSDDGAFRYTLRHMEFPQTDENRTYYTLKLTFLKDLTLNSVRDQLTLLEQDSRAQLHSEISFRDPEGNRQTVKLATDENRGETLYKLNGEQTWYTYYNRIYCANPETSDETDPMNYAVLVKNLKVVLGGKEWKGNLILRDSYGNKVNFSALSLDLGKTTFKAGDTVEMDYLMLPWGNAQDVTSDANVLRVFEDAVEKPLTLTTKDGTVMSEPHLGRIDGDGRETVEFTVTGGRNNQVVRIDGFTVLAKPVLEVKNAAGEWEIYDTSVESYDGYGVHFSRDGRYGYSFVVPMESPDAVQTYRITVKK